MTVDQSGCFVVAWVREGLVVETEKLYPEKKAILLANPVPSLHELSEVLSSVHFRLFMTTAF